jgi:Pyruvate/2-oxoacid:ferredoxin oxidoreductase delta subunit
VEPVTELSEPPGVPATWASDRYVVDADSCTACGACLLTCPEHAFVPTIPLTVDHDRCTDCGECVEVCPRDAIERVPA